VGSRRALGLVIESGLMSAKTPLESRAAQVSNADYTSLCFAKRSAVYRVLIETAIEMSATRCWVGMPGSAGLEVRDRFVDLLP
jgi:hypothetical protein